MENFRVFQAGPDPFGRIWQVELKWLQTAISIRHSDTVDAKFVLRNSDDVEEKTISMPHSILRAVTDAQGVKLTDPWCSRIALQHLKFVVESGEDMEKEILTLSQQQVAAYSAKVKEWETSIVRTRRGAA